MAYLEKSILNFTTFYFDSWKKERKKERKKTLDDNIIELL